MRTIKTKTLAHITPSEGKTPTDLSNTETLTDEVALRLGTRTLQNLRGTLNSKEVWAIGCLVAYAADHQKIDDRTVWSMLTSFLGVEDIHELSASRYDDAIRFLVDFDLSRMIH